MELLKEFLGSNVDTLESKIQEFYEIASQSEASKRDQLTKLIEFLTNLEK